MHSIRVICVIRLIRDSDQFLAPSFRKLSRFEVPYNRSLRRKHNARAGVQRSVIRGFAASKNTFKIII